MTSEQGSGPRERNDGKAPAYEPREESNAAAVAEPPPLSPAPTPPVEVLRGQVHERPGKGGGFPSPATAAAAEVAAAVDRKGSVATTSHSSSPWVKPSTLCPKGHNPLLVKGGTKDMVKLLNILAKYCETFSSMVEGMNGDMSTSELPGGARIHYIFQSIFVKNLEEVDPCEDATEEDISMEIQNANGSRSALFVPDVPFEVLVRRQISRLRDPSLQCATFIYDELVKMSHHCLATELEHFPVLRRSMDEVIGQFLHNGLGPLENMIEQNILIEAPFEAPVRGQIIRLCDPSLQCAKSIYDKLVKMSHRCLATELHHFPVLRRSMDEVIGQFLHNGLGPLENMIEHIIFMEVPFEAPVRRQINRLRDPSLQCAKSIYDKLVKVLSRFTILATVVLSAACFPTPTAEGFNVHRTLEEAADHLEALLAAEVLVNQDQREGDLLRADPADPGRSWVFEVSVVTLALAWLFLKWHGSRYVPAEELPAALRDLPPPPEDREACRASVALHTNVTRKRFRRIYDH